MSTKLRVFSGSANPALAQEICAHLGESLGAVKLKRFSDQEVNFQILENVRGMDVFIIQPTCPPVNENIMELLIMIDAFKRSSAWRITAVIPYYGYARQDRKEKPRVPISAKLVGDLISAAGAHRLLTLDLHAGQIQGFFDIPVDHLFARPVLLEYLLCLKMKKMAVVSPDAGGVERARAYAKRLGASLAIIDKRRVDDNVAEVMHLVGDVKGRNCIVIDDLIDTAGSIVRASEVLRREGAERILVAATHAVLSGPAIGRIAESDIEAVIVSNTIPLTPEKANPKITVLSVAPLLGEAIRSIHKETSVSKLFN
ncbi:MAG: ribose-phosphate pyrophosphokinase [Acidobacteria bacterium]|nr:MAG: ribose-phosphate pyrophosphokinase [Acidobacteriota bacterium]